MRLFSKFVFVTVILFSATYALAENIVWTISYQLEASGKYNEAISALESVPVNGPDAEYKTLRKAWLLYLSGRYDESIREYRFAIERNGKSMDARLGITLPFMAAKRWHDAEPGLRAVLELSPANYTALLRLSIVLEATQNWDEMAKVAELMVTNYPADATAYVYLARAKAWQNKISEAVAAYNNVLVRYPGHYEARAYISTK